MLKYMHTIFMKRFVTAHLTIPIEIDEKGGIKLLNEYTQTEITAFDNVFKPRDNMYEKIMDYLHKLPPDPMEIEPADKSVYMTIRPSGMKVRKKSANQTFKTYTNKSLCYAK